MTLSSYALYINGDIAGTSTEARQPPSQLLDFGGHRSNFGQNFYWNGLIDEVHVFNRVLTPSEIQELATLDTTPPTITVTATPDILWPPNGQMVPVTVSGMMTDSELDGTGVNPSTAAYVVTDEYGQVQPQGSGSAALNLKPDGSYSFTIYLQASRNGNDTDGRQYLITVSAQDNAGNTGSAATGVLVPHDQGQ